MHQPTDTLLFNQTNRLQTTMQQMMRGLRKLSIFLSPLPISELLLQLEEASSPASLTKIVNTIQTTIWKQASKDKSLARKHMLNVLTKHVLQARDGALRLEAAGWLRLLVQAGLVAQPQEIFVTLVTAAVRASQSRSNATAATATKEQLDYLKMIFQCFWPFRYPYPAFNRQLFPMNEVFYPLALLFKSANDEAQDLLISIFSELPSLDDREIAQHLLPIALQWAKHADPEHRRRIANVLARIDQGSTQEALSLLRADDDPLVRASAKSATSYVKRA